MKTLKLHSRLALSLLLVALLLTSCSLLPNASSSATGTPSVAEDTVTISKAEYDRLERYASLDELSQIVEEYYYIQPDTDAMLEGAKRGLLAGLGDPYTYYYNAEEYAKMWEDDGGEYAGIGIQISASYVTMLCTISRVFSGSPAEQSGLLKGDILLKVDDLDVTSATLNDAVDIMRGEVGKPVHIQVQRGDTLLDFDIPRAVVHVNWVSSCMLDSQVGYILLYEFSGDCAARFQEQLDALQAQGAKALIVDLRDNPGGWINDAVSLADIFLPDETVTYLQDRAGKREYYKATAGALNLPLVVMMNENSASSSEILAGALQDYGVATIVGVQSFGKGVVQYVLPLGNDGEGLQLTAAQYFTPNGRSIHKVGITPDVTVSMPEGDTTVYKLGDLTDVQLKKAYDVALEKLNGTFVSPTPSSVPTLTPSPSDSLGADAQTGEDITSQTQENLTIRVS
ncbi:MAG TPA: S41 family peptidase [Candidatus Limiplasma sp.]|mgnify:CR=1 FL=1|nr:S41 family peptidase [Candidatus Limiplasma sp.]